MDAQTSGVMEFTEAFKCAAENKLQEDIILRANSGLSILNKIQENIFQVFF